MVLRVGGGVRTASTQIACLARRCAPAGFPSVASFDGSRVAKVCPVARQMWHCGPSPNTSGNQSRCRRPRQFCSQPFLLVELHDESAAGWFQCTWQRGVAAQAIKTWRDTQSGGLPVFTSAFVVAAFSFGRYHALADKVERVCALAEDWCKELPQIAARLQRRATALGRGGWGTRGESVAPGAGCGHSSTTGVAASASASAGASASASASTTETDTDTVSTGMVGNGGTVVAGMRPSVGGSGSHSKAEGSSERCATSDDVGPLAGSGASASDELTNSVMISEAT